MSLRERDPLLEQASAVTLAPAENAVPPEAGPPVARPAEQMVPGIPVVEDFSALADAVLADQPRLGGVRLVSVDGRAGSGKTTFAGRLAGQLTSRGAEAKVLHTDDLLQGWLDIVTFWPRLEEWVLAPLRGGQSAKYRRFDWAAGRFRSTWETLGRPDVLLLEGVTSARAEIRPQLTRSIYVQVDRKTRFQRGVRRDGESVIPDWNRWMSDEDQHFAVDRTAEMVDVLVDGDPSAPHQPNTQYVRILPPHRTRQGCT
jgi:uridine kinase